jgi:hypothetical protein
MGEPAQREQRHGRAHTHLGDADADVDALLAPAVAEKSMLPALTASRAHSVCTVARGSVGPPAIACACSRGMVFDTATLPRASTTWNVKPSSALVTEIRLYPTPSTMRPLWNSRRLLTNDGLAVAVTCARTRETRR